jgi:hypothetical protein
MLVLTMWEISGKKVGKNGKSARNERDTSATPTRNERKIIAKRGFSFLFILIISMY